VADFDFPAELVDLQRRFYEAGAECARISATFPPGPAIAAGDAQISDEQHALRDAAHERWLQIAEQLLDHEWFKKLERPERLKARYALQAAAQSESETSNSTS
jgi:hypothetical protein